MIRFTPPLLTLGVTAARGEWLLLAGLLTVMAALGCVTIGAEIVPRMTWIPRSSQVLLAVVMIGLGGLQLLVAGGYLDGTVVTPVSTPLLLLARLVVAVGAWAFIYVMLFAGER